MRAHIGLANHVCAFEMSEGGIPSSRSKQISSQPDFLLKDRFLQCVDRRSRCQEFFGCRMRSGILSEEAPIDRAMIILAYGVGAINPLYSVVAKRPVDMR